MRPSRARCRIREAFELCTNVARYLTVGQKNEIARAILREIASGLGFCNNVGLEYLGPLRGSSAH